MPSNAGGPVPIGAVSTGDGMALGNGGGLFPGASFLLNTPSMQQELQKAGVPGSQAGTTNMDT